MSKENNDFEFWTSNKSGQYRVQNQELTDEVQLYFWIPNEPNKYFSTTYENLLKIIENTSDKSLYSIIP